MSAASTSASKEWVLEPETEYRFELDPGTSLAIKLAKGHAEVFGAELAEGKTYLFGHECKAAIFTWQGCTIEMSPLPVSPFLLQSKNRPEIVQHVTGHPSTEYVSEETPMYAYANAHLALEAMRVRALRALHGSPPPTSPPETKQDAPSEPPRVLVLGPENSGKTTVCKILINYAVRAGQDWTPLYVNVDPSEVRFIFFEIAF
ncbi:hypothetical protein EW146_g3646 [Bondarzewia mesenterica]|uniref:Polynucleotide 5'-hydroxyl-kinase GRC3 n=1 Tax=Bondarzewia mesenterica TaxID=1095465 RepID=A0A4S4LWZ6_9AGAM|nr:hypothetical protein EW146_g3646 [Bondarzewia mesenterica]